MALSRRAADAAQPDPKFMFWDILADIWHPATNPSGFVCLGLAENTLMHETLSQHIHSNLSLSHDDFTYGDGQKHLRAVMARFLTRHLQPSSGPIDPSHIRITNGCTSAIEHAAWAFGNPGDVFLLGRPYYGAFVPDVTLRMGTGIDLVSFGPDVDPVSVEAVAKYEESCLAAEARGVRVAGIILANPHNPLGRCYPREALVELMRLCQRRRIHLISDEVYALSVFPNPDSSSPSQNESQPPPFTSVLSIDAARDPATEGSPLIDPALVHVIWGLSKDFGANGLRLGAIISRSNPALHAALKPVSLYSSSSSMADAAAAALLSDDAWTDSYIAQNRQLLSSAHAHVAAWARDNAIQYAGGVNAAFFLWVNLGEAYRTRRGRGGAGVEKSKASSPLADDNIAETIMTSLLRHKVFLASGVQFGSEEPGWFRIVFSQEKAYLDEGLRRIIAAIEEPEGM